VIDQVRRYALLGIAIALAVFAPLTSHAQAVYGSIFGTVTDNSGAIVPNATITVTDESKGTSVTTQSNSSGDYRVEHLIPDLYSVKIDASGFESFVATHIQVLADTSPKVDAKLTVGAASQTVTVNADTIPVLKADRADVSTTFTEKTVSDLPIAGRNFTSLQLLLPGAQPLGWSHAADENPQASQQIQIDGQAFGGVAYELDGTDNQDPILGIIVVNPAIDAVSESKIATQNFDAEFGKAVSAVVTAQTKSGSNSFHGSAFDYRKSNFNLARDPYTQFAPNAVTGRFIPPGLYSQFGGSIGGPFIKDKMFFFGDYQGQRQKLGSSASMTVPSAHLVSTCLGQAATVTGVPGCDFSEYATALGANGIIYQPNGQPYPGNVIPAAQLSTPALNLFRLLQPYKPNKTGNFNGLQNNYAGSGTGLFNADQWDERVDFQATQNIHAFERFSRFTDTLGGGTIFGSAGGAGFGLNGFGGNSQGANDSLAAGADIAVSSSLLTDFRIGYYRYNIATSKYDQGVPFATQLGIPGINFGDRFTSGAPGFNITDVGANGNPSNAQSAGAQYGSGLNITRCNCPTTEREDQGQIVNNWTKIKGNHSIKMGADLRYARNLRVPSDTDRAGLLSFATGPTSNPSLAVQGGLGFASFVLGDVTAFGRYITNPNIPNALNAKEFQKRVFFYGQDTWRVNAKLTVNYGLRWELYWPEVVNGAEHGALMRMQNASSQPPSQNPGFLRVAGVGGIPTSMGWNISYGALAPRVGVAYQLNPTTVVRAGYGRSFDLGVFGSIFGHTVTQNLPILANQQQSQTGGVTSSVFNLPTGPPLYAFPTVPSNGLLPNPGYAVTSKARPDSLRLPTIDAWNLSIQRALTPTFSVTMAYVGNKGTHTLSAGDGNNTNPNEAGIFLPAQYSITGQPLHYDPRFPNSIGPGGATGNATFLSRYYGGTLPACSSPSYTPQPGVPRGACGWTNSIQYLGDDQDTHYNALQITFTKQFTRGLAFNANYAWQRAYNWAANYVTWDRTSTKGRDTSLREQQLVAYGNYELPIGKGQLVGGNVSNWADEIIGHWQLSPILNYSSGLPFTLTYSGCSSSVPGSAPCYPNGRGSSLPLRLGSYSPATHNRFFYQGATVPLTTQPFSNFSAAPLDTIGNSGRNNVFGPHFFNMDLAVQKNFPIRENLFAQFRMDAYNVFNHINAGLPSTGCGPDTCGTIDQGAQFISQGPGIGGYTNPRQLQLSVRIQF
jgi:Carboxypeptidase regulatory-like domain/TonB dependent receptor